MTIVTKQSLQVMLDDSNKIKVMHVVGRALVAIFSNQTSDEQESNITKLYNNIGFNGPDARSGSLTAKSYIKSKQLSEWQVEKWTKRDKSGFSRLAKYHSQLNAIAEAKRK